MQRTLSCVQLHSVATRPSLTELLIEIETNEAKASIIARERQKTLDIAVHRFRNRQILSQGSCESEYEIDRRLNSLCANLSASPFA